MNAKARYFKIGIFLLAGIVLFVFAVVIFAGGHAFKRQQMIETYFESSVQGIDIGSPIKFRGYKIGDVKEIRVAAEIYNTQKEEDALKYGTYIVVRGALDAEVMDRLVSRLGLTKEQGLVKRGLRIKMSPLGITGLSYLELDVVDPEQYPTMKIPWKSHYEYIPSMSSPFENIVESISGINRALKDDVYPFLQNLNTASKRLPTISEQVQTTLSELHHMLNEQRREVGETLENLRLISSDIQAVTTEMKYNPSRLLFGEPPEATGVKP